MLFFEKLVDLGSACSKCLCDVSEYLRLDDCRLFNCTQSSSHWISHLLPPEKHHFGLCLRGHRYTLLVCQTSFVNPFLYHEVYFFPIDFFSFTVFDLQCLYYCITYAFVICLIRRYSSRPNFGRIRGYDPLKVVSYHRDPKKHQWLHRHVVWAITRQNRLSGVCCRLTDGVKKVTSKKGQKLMVQVGGLPHPPAQPITTKIGMGCPVADVISHVKFQLYRLRGFRAPNGSKSLSPIDLRHHPYNSYALTCYTVIF